MKLLEQLRLRKTVRAITRRTLLIRGATIALLGLVLITGIVYMISVFYNTKGSFTISLNKYDVIQNGLSLSENAQFIFPTERLTVNPLTNVNNISVYDLPDNLGDFDGDHGTKDYIAYTFYIKNAGINTCTYSASINIINSTMGIDAAVRVRVYKNNVYTDYAKLKNDGTGPERGTTPFLSQTVVYSENRVQFAPDDVDKYTIVVWLEGDDPECVDDIIGGTIKMQMDFKIIESS